MSSRGSSSYSDNYPPLLDEDDMKFRKIGNLFNSFKSEAKPIFSNFASEAKSKSSLFVNETRSRLADGGYIPQRPPVPPRSRNSSTSAYSSQRSEFTNVKDNSNSKQSGSFIDDDGNSLVDVPENSEITLYPSYTLSHDGHYYVEVRGWLTCAGTLSRKNKIIFSLAKQLIKPGAHHRAADLIASNFAMQATGHADNASDACNASANGNNLSPVSSAKGDRSASNLLDVDDAYSVRSNATDLSMQSSSASLFYNPTDTTNKAKTAEDVLRERMAYFFAKSLASVPLKLTICSEDHLEPANLISKTVVTDLNGKFETVVKTPYKPSLVQASVENGTHPVLAFQEILHIGARGVSVISDIDDTIKDTQVISDKRTVFNNVFVKDLMDAAIPSVASFYGKLAQRDVLFHYVSNSPWQIYPTMRKFLELSKFPRGSIHLKQYTGNILSSLMEPANERKRQTLYKIFEELPERQFILIGDSGEQDLEAYLDVSRRFPTQVLKIYIRVVPGSLSDFNDIKILREMKRLLSLRKERIELKKEYSRFASSLSVGNDTKNDIAGSSGEKRAPPKVPPARKRLVELFEDNGGKTNKTRLDKSYSGESDSSSPETSEDEMDQPNYDWNILSHEPMKRSQSSLAKSASTAAANASATVNAAAFSANSNSSRGSLSSLHGDGFISHNKPILNMQNRSMSPTSIISHNVPILPTKKSTYKRKPPIVPKKPKNLQGHNNNNNNNDKNKNNNNNHTNSHNTQSESSSDSGKTTINNGTSTNTGSGGSSSRSTNDNDHDLVNENQVPVQIVVSKDSCSDINSVSKTSSNSESDTTHKPKLPPRRRPTVTPSAATVSAFDHVADHSSPLLPSSPSISTSSSATGLVDIDSRITRSAPALDSSPRKTSSLLSSTITFDPKVIKHSATDAGIITSGSSHATQIIDRKGELWLQRLTLAIGALADHIDLVFWITPSDIEDDCLAAVDKVEKTKFEA